jgi:acylphosphatase
MGEKITCTRILLDGITSYAIQGINLRENIEEYVRMNIGAQGIRPKGKISNLKNGQVEIIFCGEKSDLDKLAEYLDNLKRSDDKQQGKVIRKKETYDIQIESDAFDDFTVERSDDLSEMVWALRGAGIRFEHSTEALKKIHTSLEERDKNTAIGKLLTLHFELMHNIRLIASIKNVKGKKKGKGIITVALRANIENPAVATKIQFVYTLGEVYSDLADFEDGILSDTDIILTKLNALLKLTEEQLAERGKKL